MLIIFEGTDTTVDPFHWKTLLTFSLSVLSAAFGMSRFFNVGPCRLVPYGKMNVGFIFLVISIATCLVGKGTVYFRTVVHLIPSWLVWSGLGYAGLLMGDDIGSGLSSMFVYFDFCSTNVVKLSNRKPCFYRFQYHHPLIENQTK